MNSREKVLAALNHQETGQVPVDFSGHRSSSISAIAYHKLRDYLALEKKPIRVYDIVQQLAVVDEDVLQRFGVNAIELGRGFALDDKDWAEWVLPDGTPCLVPVWSLPERESHRWVIRSKTGQVIAQMPDGALYFEQVHYPYFETPPTFDHIEEAMDEAMWTAITTPPGPLVEGLGGDERLVAGAQRFRASTERAIIGLFGGNLLETGQFLFRNDQFFMLLAGEPDRAHEFLERLTEIHLRKLEKYLGLLGPYIDIILFGDDLGMQNGPQISPRMYREFFKPLHQRMWRRAKELADVKVMLHSCGSLRALLPDLIDAGLDAVNPVQLSTQGMDAASLKRDFGEEITFWGGGCDTHHVLPHGTPQQVRQHVIQQIRILKPGGGFVFQQVHNILADVPPENIVAMFDAVQQGNRA